MQKLSFAKQQFPETTQKLGYANNTRGTVVGCRHMRRTNTVREKFDMDWGDAIDVVLMSAVSIVRLSLLCSMMYHTDSI